MGEALGIPEWLALTLWLATGLSAAFAYGWWMLRKAHSRVAAMRPNPTEEQFLAMMAADCSPEVSRFLWDSALTYIQPRLTPHPDDNLLDDLKIDDEDLSMDWPRDWAASKGFHESNLPDWPDDWPITIRNYGRWLDMGPRFGGRGDEVNG